VRRGAAQVNKKSKKCGGVENAAAGGSAPKRPPACAGTPGQQCTRWFFAPVGHAGKILEADVNKQGISQEFFGKNLAPVGR
jgi:hypothetical protein